MKQKNQNYRRVRIQIPVLLLAGSFLQASIPSAFADIGYGARPLGMGGAYVALADDAYGVLWNPAAIANVQQTQIGTMYAKQFNLIPYVMAASVLRLPRQSCVGVGLLSSGDEVLRENTFLFSYGMSLGRFSETFSHLNIGVTVKLRQASFGNNSDGGVNQITGDATGYGFDLGMYSRVSENWRIGLLLRDFANKVNYNNETRDVNYGESIPVAMIFGTAYSARSNLMLSMDWDMALYDDVKNKIRAGCEWTVFKSIYLRSGVSQTVSGDPNRQFNWGIGFAYLGDEFGVRFDFAYQVHYLATTPRVSTTLWF